MRRERSRNEHNRSDTRRAQIGEKETAGLDRSVVGAIGNIDDVFPAFVIFYAWHWALLSKQDFAQIVSSILFYRISFLL